MTTERIPLFCDIALAERIERVEAQLTAACSDAARRRRSDTTGFVIPIAGGVASFAEENSPFNKVAGLGFGGVPTADELGEIERAFATYDAPVQVELAHLADPDLVAVLSDRGYRLESFENVLGLALPSPVDHAPPAGIEVRRGDDELESWLEMMADTAAHPDDQGVPWHEEFPRAAYISATRDLLGAGVTRYVALRNGEMAGGANYRVRDGVAQFAGAGTAPAHRRHGVQTALLTARIVDATAAGCDVAIVTTQPGSKSQQNVQRQGFDLLYTRAVLVKQP
ncbi:GNAT family N-acetyltransferase [Antrihabitans cavernicola]|uniref:GNAT family N-acetyltransferase n=1 Tax=Antrihabitans cavernicola TaxID=2495913 RepID=A0A5A7SDN3_9NOCA|nr:GNAT family N-acetyltransferase [Spelaeibacter cavernicola]KAA0022857.1 GNAT family N-acetyltransferase [Spelaeibacter cavernicola]